MKTELGTIYITDDGKKFVKKDDAIQHQMSVAPPKDISMSVYYSFEGDNDGDVVYDLDSMANNLESNILKALHIDCDVEIKEK